MDKGDWERYYAHKDNFWTYDGGHGQAPWPGAMDPGLTRFAVHVDRLSSYYYPWEKEQFMAALGFVWGGIPLGSVVASTWQMATRPGAAWAKYPPLFEGVAGWSPEYVDDENPSHHYAGLAYLGYHYGAFVGVGANWLRDGPLSDISEPDLLLGNLAAVHGDCLRYQYLFGFGRAIYELFSEPSR